MEINEPSRKQSLSSPVGESLEMFSLICLDLVTDEIQRQLRAIINLLKCFEDSDDCEQYIRSLSTDDRVVLLINGEFATKMIPRIHELRQMTSIYVHSTDTSEIPQWTSQYKKIRSMKNDLNELIAQIKLDHLKRKKLEEPLAISIFDPNQSTDLVSARTNTPFLYSQLLIQFLLHTKSSTEQILENKKELIELCRTEYEDNPSQLRILHEFEYNYSASNALWWYTLDSSLSQLLTKSLHTLNIDRLYLLQFFIHDLIRELKHFQSSSVRRVYRSYVISNEELEIFQESKGKYLTINRFFSTLINRDKALNYFNDYVEHNDSLKKVLFKIDVDPRLNKIKPFANITVLSQTADEEEILFSLGSIFRLEEIHQGKNDVYTIQLTLCSEDHHHLKPIFDSIKQQYGEDEINLFSLANALRRMRKLDEAEKCYQRLLHDSCYDQDFIGRSYHHLGRIALTKGDYETSLNYLQQSLKIKLKLVKSNDPSLAQSYNSIGIVHQEKGDYANALEAFNNALVIWRRAYGKNHPNVAGCYNNMGVVYKREKKYNEALECFQKALAIRERHSSTSHLDLAASHNNIGAVYGRLGYHDLSIEHYNISLKIKSKSLPPQHPSIGSTFENLGYVYEHRGAYLQSLSYLGKAAMIYHQSLPPIHHDVLQVDQSIKRVSAKL